MILAKALSLACLVASIPLSHGADPTWEWVKTFGGSSYDLGSGVAVDASGKVFVSGYTYGGGKLGTNTLAATQFFWSRLDSSGNIQIVRSATIQQVGVGKLRTSGDGSIYMNGSAAGGGSIGGVSLSGQFLAKFANDLTVQWVKSFTSGGVGMYRMAPPSLSPSGSVAVGGSFVNANYDGNTLTAISGGEDMLATHATAGGQLIWMKRGGSKDSDYGPATAFDSAGNLFIGGSVSSTPFIFGGTTVSTPSGEFGLVVKLKPDGLIEWAKPFGSPKGEVLCIRACSNGDMIIGGAVNESNWPYVHYGGLQNFASMFSRISTDGSVVWSQSWPGLAVNDLEIDAGGNIYVLGTLCKTTTIGTKSFTPRGDYEVFVGKFSATGSLIWGKSVGGVFSDSPGQIAVAADGAVYVVGTVTDGAFFDSLYIDGMGGGDGFIGKVVDPTASKIPAITNQPIAGATYFGNSTALSVGARSDVAVTYQWFIEPCIIECHRGQSSACV